jgi:hypothetical protein
MREVLRDTVVFDEQVQLLKLLGACLADLHAKGLEQTDCNLTNFLIGPADDIRMVDEDDVRIHQRALSGQRALSNLANLGARLPTGELPHVLMESYLERLSSVLKGSFPDTASFERQVQEKKHALHAKRAARGAAPDREYD